MRQTNRQFKSFVRLLLDALKDAESQTDEKKRKEKMEKIFENLQRTLED